MTLSPLVSVVVVTFNQGRFLQRCLKSLLAQDLGRQLYEVLVINDGSTDDTSQLLSHYRGRIRLLERENQGLVASCNEGLAAAQGHYFARVDSDDLVAPDWLSCLGEAFKADPQACCAVPDRVEIQGRKRRIVTVQPDNLYSLIACGTLFRREDLRRLGGFRPFYWEEYDLYLRLRGQGRFIRVPRPLYTYRRHPDGMTHSESMRQQGWLQLAQEWGAGTLRSAGHNPDLERALQQLEGQAVYG